MTARKTFENLENWLSEVAKYGGEEKTMKLVVGNKSDKVGRRRVSCEEGREWAERRGFMFLETSARNSSGVDTAFNRLVDKILQEPGMWENDRNMGQQELCQRIGRSGGGDGRWEGRGRWGCCN